MRALTWIAALALAAGTAPALAAAQPEGLWMSPGNDVAVRTAACGESFCGWIVWAKQTAEADARESGAARLVGTEVLENYHPDGPATWTGTVFVPDMGRRFYSHLDRVGPNALKVKGCILNGLICKSQIWTKIDRLPND